MRRPCPFGGEIMKTLRCIGAELKKFTYNLWFLMCVLAVAALSFFTVVYQDTIQDQELTAWDMATQYTQEELIAFGESLSSYEVFLSESGEALLMLVPILTAAPFAIPMALERRTGNIRFALIRCGGRRYCTANLIAAILTGGLVMLLGRALFGVLAGLLFPHLGDFSLAFDMECLQTVCLRLLGQFLFGGGSILATYLLTYVTTNYYLTICVPFLLDYVMGMVVNWAGGQFWSMGIYDNPLNVLLPDYLQGVSYLTTAGLQCLAVYSAFALLVLACGITVLERRSDRGT